jgi:benzoyl-CoA reductase/2-hydroxyglutaryl-CoA dehydratase subunit BcrC/BadD/HgdB
MKTVYYKDIYVPPEWIGAHGLRPERAMPAAAGEGLPLGAVEGVCPFTGAFIREARANSAEAVIVTTQCDQMRRAGEYIAQAGKPVFLFNMPATVTEAARGLYFSELLRLGRFLVQLGGEAPSPEKLAEIMGKYDTSRRQLRKRRASLSPRRFAEAFRALGSGEPLPEIRGEFSPGRRPRLALVGGPRLRSGLEIFELVDKAGGQVALDATVSGELGLPEPFTAGWEQKPLAELARVYFDLPHITRRPNSTFYAWLKSALRERQIAGIIVLRYLWCDLWHGEVPRLTEEMNLPLLDLVLEQETTDSARLGGRIQAFLEMLV